MQQRGKPKASAIRHTMATSSRACLFDTDRSHSGRRPASDTRCEMMEIDAANYTHDRRVTRRSTAPPLTRLCQPAMPMRHGTNISPYLVLGSSIAKQSQRTKRKAQTKDKSVKKKLVLPKPEPASVRLLEIMNVPSYGLNITPSMEAMVRIPRTALKRQKRRLHRSAF